MGQKPPLSLPPWGGHPGEQPRPYLLRGDLGFRGHGLPQPGHRSGDGHGHPDAHAVRALALVHHGHVEGPVGSTSTAGHLWALPAAASAQPGHNLAAHQAQGPAQIHLTLEVPSAAATQGCLIYTLLSYYVAWCYWLPQAEHLKKGPQS